MCHDVALLPPHVSFSDTVTNPLIHTLQSVPYAKKAYASKGVQKVLVKETCYVL